MSEILPKFQTEAEFNALRCTPEPWLLAIRALCERHDLHGDIHLFDQGSCVLFGIGEHWVIKLYEPAFIEHFHNERNVLLQVHGSLPVPTPQLQAAEMLEGWGYIIMSRLPGQSLNLVWSSLKPSDRARIAEQAGALTAAFHQLPIGDISLFSAPWRDFGAMQREGCAAQHRSHGYLPESTLDAIDALVESIEVENHSPVLLHTEITSHNLVADQTPDGHWTLSGLVDFEPSMLGPPEYDLVAPAIFVCRGDGDLLRRTLRAYGYTDSQQDRALQRRLMGYTLLHRYSHLGFFWRQLSEAPLPEGLRELTEGFFPLRCK